MRLYSNPAGRGEQLQRVVRDASSVQPAEAPRRPRQRQRRLSATETAELIKAYERQIPVKDLAKQFGVHRSTVTALLQRNGVALRQAGLAREVVPMAARFYSQGWSLAQLGAKFGVDSTTVMDAVGIQSAVLLGSSSGGYVAQQLAIQVPHRVDGLVLVGAPRSLQGRPAFADEVDRLTDPVDPTWVEESLTWFPRYHQVPDWYIKDRIRDGLRVPAHVWMAGLAGLTTAVPPSESGTITAPTLIIWGERDELLPLEDGYLLVAAIPGSRLIVYEDTGHLVLWEQPERVATDLADFIAGLSTSGQNSTPIS